MAGGTGLYPFSDLIDLLFKTILLKTRPELKKSFIENDPVLESNPFDNFTFSLYLAVGNLEDIHPITLVQLNEISRHPKFFKLTMKISSKKKETLPTEQHNINSSESVKVFYNEDKNIILNEHVEYTSQRFSGVLRQSLSTE